MEKLSGKRGVDKFSGVAAGWLTRTGDIRPVVGACYEAGLCGVAQDHAEAVKCDEIAAARGNSLAHTLLGIQLLAGPPGVPQDNVRAVAHFRVGVEAGITLAIEKLGVCYTMGYGVERDLKEARRLISLALKAGDSTDAAEVLEQIDAAGRSRLQCRSSPSSRGPRCAALKCDAQASFVCSACHTVRVLQSARCQARAWKEGRESVLQSVCSCGSARLENSIYRYAIGRRCR